MAEYYPLLAKAVGSLPNSTPESRRVVYERARKALIGQLRTLHPPVPDDDIETESVALDRAIERLESELANGGIPAAAATAPAAVKTSGSGTPASPAPAVKPPRPAVAVKPPTSGATPDTRTVPPLRTKVPKPPGPREPSTGDTNVASPPPARVPVAQPPAPLPPSVVPAGAIAPAVVPDSGLVDMQALPPAAEMPPRLKPPRQDPARSEAQRPIAPQPPVTKGPKRRLWIIPVVVVVVMASVAYAAYKLRDRPETIAHGNPTEQKQADSGKIAERVGGPSQAPSGSDTTPTAPQETAAQPSEAPATGTAPQTQQTAPAAANPDLPVAHRAALLVEAPNEPNKVKTFLGTVVWKLNNVPQGPNDSVGLAVEADIDLPDDKMKAVVTFAKNTEASLPASHTINVRYSVEPGSFTGDVKQISVPQMRPESSPSGEALAGVTVQIVPNSFLVGLSPGNAETANTQLIRRLQWIDIPMLLDSGKIAKLTFEKSDSGDRDLAEALDAWAKQ